MTNEESSSDTISCVMNEVLLPSGTRSPISLPPILEPIRDLRMTILLYLFKQNISVQAYLCQSKSGFLGQLSLLIWCWVPIVFVTFLQRVSGLLLEAVDCLLAVPDCSGKRIFPPESILINRAWLKK